MTVGAIANNEGNDVLLVPGMCQTGHALARLSRAFTSHGLACRTATLPGHGGTNGKGIARLSLSDYADFLIDEVRAWRTPTPPIVVGHSMGGLLALKLAAACPLSALVLLTPAPPAGVAGLTPIGVLLSAVALGRDPGLRKGFLPAFAAFSRTAMQGLPSVRQKAMYEGLVPESARAVLEMGLWPLDMGEAARVDFSHIRCPSYLVSAGRDRLVSASSVKKLAGLLPDASLRHWPRRCHMVTDDPYTEDMVGEIVTWLAGLELQRRSPRAQPTAPTRQRLLA